MKYLRFAATFVVSLTIQPLRATTDTELEFKKLTQERDRAVAAATEPLNRKYETEIQALMRRAALADDLDTVIQIKKALTKLAETRDKAAVVGKWDFLNRDDGHKGTVEFNADKTYSSGGKRLGVWKIKEKRLAVTFDHLDHNQDWYELPIRDGQLTGTNSRGQVLMIKRISE